MHTDPDQNSNLQFFNWEWCILDLIACNTLHYLKHPLYNICYILYKYKPHIRFKFNYLPLTMFNTNTCQKNMLTYQQTIKVI